MNNGLRSSIRISTIPQLSPDLDRVLIEVRLPDGSQMQAIVEYLFRVTKSEIDDLQWYFEKFLEFDEEPAPTIARGIEKHLHDRGSELFCSVLDGNEQVRALWRAFQPHIADADFELVSGQGSGSAVHWEFLREPEADRPLSMRMHSFVHVPVMANPPVPALANAQTGQLRVLLAIERPGGIGDVPYRSVAAGLVRAASDDTIKIDVLRPPDFEQLASVLEDAAKAGRPYDILHFDGHGTYGATGGRILFEDPGSFNKSASIDGQTLGTLMAKTGTKTLVLNACRSAFADPRVAKGKIDTSTYLEPSLVVGSFAEQSVRAGVHHVVAMRYNLYVTTATQFFSAFYDALSQGRSLGSAVALARCAVASYRKDLQDWSVPALYRGEGVVSQPDSGAELPLPIASEEHVPNLFVGRNETIYQIDRALDSASIILLHGQAGVGKTAVAREFARWYQTTNGVNGPAVCTLLSEDAEPTLFQVEQPLAALPDFVSRIAGHQSLWIIDDLDFLTPTHRQRLFGIVLEAARQGAKVILISTDGNAWIHPYVVPIVLPPMRMDECQELASSYRHFEAGAMRSLLQFSQGNPQVLHLVLDLAAQADLSITASLDELVDHLADDNADLSFERFAGLRRLVDDLRRRLPALDARQRAMIAPLCLFREHVAVVALGTMGNPGEWQLPALAGVTAQELVYLLRAIERVGLAQTLDFTFGLHPLLHIVLRPMFDEQYPHGSADEKRVRRAFCGALAKGCNDMISTYNNGRASVLGLLQALDASLAGAWEMICRESWWSFAPMVLSARCLYAHETSQDSLLQRLLEQSANIVADQTTHAAAPGREQVWEVWTSFRVRLLRKQGHWKDAEELVLGLVSFDRLGVSGALSRGAHQPWSLEEQRSIATLASDLYQLGIIKLARSDEAAAGVLQEAAELARRANSAGLAAKIETLSARVSLLVGSPPTSIPPELKQAIDGGNRVAAATAYVKLGQLRLELLNRLLADNPDDSDSLLALAREIIQAAKAAFQKVLEVAPQNLQGSIAEANLGIGECEIQAGNYGAAQVSLAEALRFYDGANQPADAAAARFFLAMALRGDNRIDLALVYASAALQYYRKSDPARADVLLADFPGLQEPAAAVD